MFRLCVITQCSLPVPAIKGGAVETLVEYILDSNEINKKLDITVLSVNDEDAALISKKYKFSHFIYFNRHNKLLNSCLKFVFRVLKKIGIYISPSLEYMDINKFLKKNVEKYDFFLFEGGPTTQLTVLNRYIPKNKLLLHLHWDGMATPRKDACFAYLLSISNYVGKCWKQGSGCENDKIKLLPNCVDVSKFDKVVTEKEKIELREKLNIESDDLVLVYIGRIVKEKGVLELINAYQLIRTKKVKLLLIGSANFGNRTYTEYEKAVIDAIDNSKNPIIRTGYIHQSQLYKYYAISDIAIMPSQFEEPAGLVALEALATGTPLIATRVGGLPEYVSEQCAILLDKDEQLINNLACSIDELLKDKERRKEMSIHAKNFAKEFDVDNYYRQFVNIIEEISDKG